MNMVAPGSTLGILGSGQLGRMFAMAAQQMGYRVHVLSPAPDSPAGQVAAQEFVVDYADADAVSNFAKSIDAATIEFENIPLDTMRVVSNHAPVRPGHEILQQIQNRLCEKQFLSGCRLPLAPFLPIANDQQLQDAMQHSFPAVLKTASAGYDGKGQQMVQSSADLAAAWKSLGSTECVLEAFVNYVSEFSVIAARGIDGTVACYQPILNEHQNHILDVSRSPSQLADRSSSQAMQIANAVANQLNYVGVLCIEFFLLANGDVVINEIAPRPHNSGHLTINAHVTSQFEQQVRAVCGLPLGSTDQLRPAAMANLLGDCWKTGPPDWAAALETPGTSLHLYGKAAAMPGRKMGHVTSTAESADQAAQLVRTARNALNAGDASIDTQQVASPRISPSDN